MMAEGTVHLHRRSHCTLCGARAWTRSVAARVSFLNAHVHDTSPWAPARPHLVARLPYRWPTPMLGTCVGVVAALIVVLP